MNKLILRQIKKYFGDMDLVPREFKGFIQAISDAYDSFENDLEMMERSFDLSSHELIESNEELKRLVDSTKQAKEQLENSRKALKIIIDSMPFGVVIIGTDKKILVVNREAIKIAGYDTTEELLGKTCNSCICPTGEGKCPILDLKQNIDKTEKELKTRDGRIIPILKSVIPIKLGDKEALLEGFVDLSAKKKAEKEKEKLEMQLVQAQKLETIGTLAGGIAHDFNNILGIIFGYAEIIKKNAEKDSQLHNNIEHLLKASRYGRDLVKQILTFSRHAEPEYRSVKIQDILDESLKLMEASLPSTIKIQKNIDRSCAEVKADDTQLKQVIANLCTNAAHAMNDNGGLLIVELNEEDITPDIILAHPEASPGRHVVLTVSDNGHGMDENTLKRIFEPFFTTKGKKAKGGGIGLGLSVIHGIVMQHHGIITASSTPGQGSVFKVYLPVIGTGDNSSGENMPDTVSFDLQGDEVMCGKETVLFVDDEERIVAVGKEMLEKCGYTVEGVQDAQVALDIFRQDPYKYDIVITDQVMPKITGSELAKEMLTIKPDLPVILTTGYSETVTTENYKKYGIREYLLKPLAVQDLCRAIRKAIEVEDG